MGEFGPDVLNVLRSIDRSLDMIGLWLFFLLLTAWCHYFKV